MGAKGPAWLNARTFPARMVDQSGAVTFLNDWPLDTAVSPGTTASPETTASTETAAPPEMTESAETAPPAETTVSAQTAAPAENAAPPETAKMAAASVLPEQGMATTAVSSEPPALVAMAEPTEAAMSASVPDRADKT